MLAAGGAFEIGPQDNPGGEPLGPGSMQRTEQASATSDGIGRQSPLFRITDELEEKLYKVWPEVDQLQMQEGEPP